ncbi:endonuclease/exonuclease/phosphatase family protein [Adhaeretor mobilis]|uniref:Endonuclease/Exonuclease/phosphatase family protein n=1 Tax=Adhaeretor mobilis TaxID=1930276 RepID=A0A517MUP0_9BACT|nr:endonuclease/exonuclease/phosphatase family protein [Adhaeretor mobilis]QDS98601.1 Endonuclease/Exonuclease/phosphatase family protein [Adhaeretor mobilis]
MRSLQIFSLALACVLNQFATPASAETPVRIVTFNAEILTAPGIRAGNLEKYRWDIARRAQFERVASIIEVLNPDILNLVEVTSKEGVDLLIEILHEKGLTDLHGYHVENNDSYTGMDVALITRFEPVEVDGARIRTLNSEENDPTWRQAFPAVSRKGNKYQATTSISRNAVYLMDIDGHKLGFLGLHLKSNPSDEYANAKRSAQAEIAKRVVQQEIVSRGYTPIILGDINDYDPDVPDRDETRDTATTVLSDLKDFDPSKPGSELFNVAKLMPRQADRFTSLWDRNENGVMDPFDVMTMIDHILLPQAFEPYVKRAFIFHSIDLTTTDHLAVVVDLLLPRKVAVPATAAVTQ